MRGTLGPNERVSIDFTVLVSNKMVSSVAYGRPLDEVLILEIKNGRHIFISLQGEFQRTCFGVPLEYLASLGGKGIRNVDLSSIRKPSGGGMPDELWRMTDFILTYGQSYASVFLERGDGTLCKGIRECLDTGREFDEKLGSMGEIGVLSMGETLLRYLDALPSSIIPTNAYDKAIKISEYKGSLMDVLPSRRIGVNNS